MSQHVKISRTILTDSVTITMAENVDENMIELIIGDNSNAMPVYRVLITYQEAKALGYQLVDYVDDIYAR